MLVIKELKVRFEGNAIDPYILIDVTYRDDGETKKITLDPVESEDLLACLEDEIIDILERREHEKE